MAEILSIVLSLVLIALNMALNIFVSGLHTVEKNAYFWVDYL